MASPNELVNATANVLEAREPRGADASKDEQPAMNVGSGPSNRFIPYHSPLHNPTKGRYITSNDPRGYIPVYEYPLNGQWIMMDMDDGYILWTGIWKALGNHKADIVKMLESQPDLATQLRRVRGGYLKIQGTWLAYEVALRLARRVAWPIRHDLVPLFGPTFPTTCLSPDQPGYGTVIPTTGRRKPRRSLQSVGIPPPHGVPYPPKPLSQEHSYSAGPDAGLPVNPSMGDPVGDSAPYRLHSLVSAAPVENGSISFSRPAIPAVPALVPTAGVAYSPQEPVGPSQYTGSAPTCPSSHELPSKTRYSPYTLPRRNQSPSAHSASFAMPSSLGYDKPRSLVHRASDPNLRSFRHRNHLLIPRLTLNTNGLLPPGERSHVPQLASAGPELRNSITEEPKPTEGRNETQGNRLGISSSDSAHSSVPTPPFSEVASTPYDHAWSTMPSGLEMGHDHWAEEYAAIPYDQGSQFYTEPVPPFSDPASLSPRTTWSYEAYGRRSPKEPSLTYPAHRSLHNHYSSLSSIGSYDDQRLSMADSIAVSFPEPDMPVPHVAYHRYSQPQLYHPVPPPHLDLWMKERSGSFAEASYGPSTVMEGVHHGYPESSEMYVSMPTQTYTPSPLSSHTPEQQHQTVSSVEDMTHSHHSISQVIGSEPPVAAVW